MYLLGSPLTWLFVGPLLWLLVRHLRMARGWRVAALLPSVVAVPLMTPAGANALLALVEAGPAPTCALPAGRPLLVLSGGLLREPVADDDFEVLAPSSVARAEAALRWHRQHLGATMMVIGGGGWQRPESRLLVSWLVRAGIPGELVQAEEQSTDTWGVAAALRARPDLTGAGVHVMTSALHMPRVLLILQEQGWAVCPWPVDRQYAAPGGLTYWLPQSTALRKTEMVVHELVGLAWYRLRMATIATRR